MISERFRSAYRALRASRGLWVAAILSIAIGVGGNVTVFSLINAVVLKPLGYPDPDQLAAITQHDPTQMSMYRTGGVCPNQFLQWRKAAQSFQSISIALKDNRNLSGSGEPEALGGIRVSAEFFDTLRSKPQLGRWFRQWEERRGAPDVVIVSDSLWRRRFSADPAIIGRKILLGDVPHEVIGVTDPNLWLIRGRQFSDWDFADRIDLFLPLHMTAREEQGEPNFAYLAIGRLKPGIPVEQARAELQVTIPTFVYEGNEKIQVQVQVESLQSALSNPSRKALTVLLAAVGLVLLIVCVNVANLLLVRAAGRQRELAIRVTLGASRWHLLADSLAESLVLSASGVVVGLASAWWLIQAVIRWAPADVARIDQAGIDGRVLMFAAALTIATTLVFGLLPVWRLSLFSPNEFLHTQSRTTTEGVQGHRIRTFLVSSEAALGTVLLIVALLFLISFQRVLNVPRGFQSENVLSVDVILPPVSYGNLNTQTAFFQRVRDGIAAAPGVLNVAAITTIPLTSEWNNAWVGKEGTDQVPLAERPVVSWPSVSRDYFAIMNIPLLAGRIFQDEGETERVAVVSETAARILWPGEYPIGRKIRHWMSAKSAWLRVIGVVADVRSNGLDQAPPPLIYRPFSQRGGTTFSIVVHTTLQARALQPIMRQQIWKVDDRIPVPAMRTIAEIVSQSVATRRMETTLIGVFAIVAALLAGVGIFGVVSYSVLKRTREFAVRLALGANQQHIRLLILRHGMTPVLVGMASGVLATIFAMRLIRSLLFDVATVEPFAFVAGALALAVSGLLPCYRAAQKAARTDPALALQAE